MTSMRESRDSDRFLVNTQVQQSHALLRRGFGTSVPFIEQAIKNTIIINQPPHNLSAGYYLVLNWIITYELIKVDLLTSVWFWNSFNPSTRLFNEP